jgi:hypothetical protein
MPDPENKVFALSGFIIPASITQLRVPDLNYSGSGSVTVGGSSPYSLNVYGELESSWSVDGISETEFVSEWNVGEGDYYWYRVEGACGEMRCDTTGILHDSCERMTFMTVVGARNLSELCYKLANPVINPKVDFRLSSIRKYSRPIGRSDSDICNTLEEQEFCQIAECLDYCIDQDIVERINFSARAIEATLIVEMSGGFSLYGQVQTDRHKFYQPDFPLIGFSGVSESLVILNYAGSGNLSLLGLSETVSSRYNYDSAGGFVLGGFARTVSPNRKYSESDGSLTIYGEARVAYRPKLDGGIALSGSSENFFSMKFGFSGKIQLGGRLLDYTSPTFFASGSGPISLSGSSGTNFSQIGTSRSRFSLQMRAFDFSSESSNPGYGSNLTISDFSISPPCGCGPMPLSIPLLHNLSNSSFINSFFKGSGLAFSDTTPLRYAAKDSSWSSTQHFLGRGRDGETLQDLTMTYALSCSGGFWEFYFSALTLNRFTGDQLQTKFILDIPSDLICSDNDISTTIEADIKGGEFRNSTGQIIPVTSPARLGLSNPGPRIADFFVDGVFNDKRVYYDEIGLFKNRYWSRNRLKINVNLLPKKQMQKMDLYRIFPS